MSRDYVFGYGSLTDSARARDALLRGHRRRWGVAMDNAQAIPGYKRYKASDGSWPDVCVAFLDLEPAAEDAPAVNGVLVPAGRDRLRTLDARERQYTRVDVTELIEGPPGGTVWTYVGLEASRERLHAAREAGRAVVARGYEQGVRDAFAARGGLERFDATTAPHGLPVRALRRVPLPRFDEDGRHAVIDGRRWRTTDPDLPEARRQELVRELMSARSAVGHAKRRGDADAERAARARVHAAKVALGERG
jgi:hypothetical protein